MANFKIGATYNFQVYKPSVLRSNYKGVVCRAVLDYDTARRFGDLEGIQAQVADSLPANAPRQLSKYVFIRVEFTDGTTAVLATAWIIDASVVEVDTVSGTAVFKLDSGADLDKVRQMFVRAGIELVSLGLN